MPAMQYWEPGKAVAAGTGLTSVSYISMLTGRPRLLNVRAR
jgi:hypothetical protein